MGDSLRGGGAGGDAQIFARESSQGGTLCLQALPTFQGTLFERGIGVRFILRYLQIGFLFIGQGRLRWAQIAKEKLHSYTEERKKNTGHI